MNIALQNNATEKSATGNKTTRNIAWRRYQNHIHRHKGMGCEAFYKPEKNWKHLYFRSNKLSRAKQLGFDYPRKSVRQLLDDIEIDNLSDDLSGE